MWPQDDVSDPGAPVDLAADHPDDQFTGFLRTLYENAAWQSSTFSLLAQ